MSTTRCPGSINRRDQAIERFCFCSGTIVAWQRLCCLRGLRGPKACPLVYSFCSGCGVESGFVVLCFEVMSFCFVVDYLPISDLSWPKMTSLATLKLRQRALKYHQASTAGSDFHFQ